jgi:hypothetical protein
MRHGSRRHRAGTRSSWKEGFRITDSISTTPNATNMFKNASESRKTQVRRSPHLVFGGERAAVDPAGRRADGNRSNEPDRHLS